jgi:enamine deaminase RidA (YjgF/YER057c/UK114 family)
MVDGVARASNVDRRLTTMHLKVRAGRDHRDLLPSQRHVRLGAKSVLELLAVSGQQRPSVQNSFRCDSMRSTHIRSCFLVALNTLPLSACAPEMRRQVVNPPGISPLLPAYSVAIRHGDMVFVSGMTGIKPGTQEIIEGGVAVQTRQTLENIRITTDGRRDDGRCRGVHSFPYRYGRLYRDEPGVH